MIRIVCTDPGIPVYAATAWAAVAMFVGVVCGYFAGCGGGSTVQGDGGTM